MVSVLIAVVVWFVTYLMPFLAFDDLPGVWNSIVDVISTVLDQDVFSWFNINDGATGPALSTITTIIEALNPVAYALVTMIWFFGVLKYEASFQDLKRPEILFRHFFRFAIAVALVALVPELVALIWSTGLNIARNVGLGTSTDLGHVKTTELSALFKDSFSDLGESERSLAQDYVDGKISFKDLVGENWATGLNEFSSILLLPIISTVVVVGARIAMLYCGFQILSNIISRFFRIVLLYLLGPIAMSSLASEGTQKVGIQYLKNTIAVSTEVSMTVLLLRVFSEVTTYICTKTEIPNALLNMTKAMFSGMLHLDKAVFNNNTIISSVLCGSVSTTLLLLLCIFILQSSIKGLDNIVDSLFGLRGV